MVGGKKEMSKTCKRMALLLALTMMMAFVGAYAEEMPEVANAAEEVIAAETPAEEPQTSSEPVEEETETPAEEETETPAEEKKETPAEEKKEEKPEVTVGYASVIGGTVVYAEPGTEEGNTLGAFNSSSYLYVLERCTDQDWLRVVFAYSEYGEILIMEGYVKTANAAKVPNDEGAGSYLYNGVGLATSSFTSFGATPDAFVDPETKVASEKRKEKYAVNANGQAYRVSTGEVISTKEYVVTTSGPKLNYRAVSDGAVEGCLENGSTVRVIEYGSHWSFLLIGGKVYTAMSSNLVDPSELEETLPDNAKLMSVIQDALDKRRSVSIYMAYDGEYVNFGDTVSFYAVLEGYEGTEYEIRWQVSADDENWSDIEGANATRFDLVVTEDNYENYYRAAVTLTGVEVDDDLL